MKKLFSVLAIVAALTFAANNANAQESFGSAGLEFALPVGDFADGSSIGIGGTGHFEIGLSDNFAVLANAGIIFFDSEVDDVSIFHIPVQVGARYYLSEQKDGLFIAAKAGMHFQTISVDVEGAENESDAYFSAAPELGFFVTENLSLALRYQLIFVPEEEIETTFTDPLTGTTITTTVTQDATTLGYIGLRAAYNF